MRKYSLILLFQVFYPFFCAQQQDYIIREDRVGNDTVVWKGLDWFIIYLGICKR